MNRLPEEIKSAIPDELVPAVEALSSALDDTHFKCGKVTEIFCYGLLHPGERLAEIEEHKLAFHQLKIIVGSAVTATCDQQLRIGTAPAFFHAMNQLYAAGVAIQAVQVFSDLIEIGSAHADHLGKPHIQWARNLTLDLVKTYEHRIKLWIRAVCDPPDFDTNLNWRDPDEIVMGKTWCAPRLIIMRPSRDIPFDATRQWERTDRETSKAWLNSFAEIFTIHIKIRIDRLSDEKTVEFAKRPKPVPEPKAKSANSNASMQAASGQAMAEKVNVKRAYRRGKIEERNRRIRGEFKKLEKRKPNMSSVWYSEQLAKSEAACGLNAETIRKIVRQN